MIKVEERDTNTAAKPETQAPARSENPKDLAETPTHTQPAWPPLTPQSLLRMMTTDPTEGAPEAAANPDISGGGRRPWPRG
jgi:hypothetical protein